MIRAHHYAASAMGYFLYRKCLLAISRRSCWGDWDSKAQWRSHLVMGTTGALERTAFHFDEVTQLSLKELGIPIWKFQVCSQHRPIASPLVLWSHCHWISHERLRPLKQRQWCSARAAPFTGLAHLWVALGRLKLLQQRVITPHLGWLILHINDRKFGDCA